jgi:hypothetical protein
VFGIRHLPEVVHKAPLAQISHEHYINVNGLYDIVPVKCKLNSLSVGVQNVHENKFKKLPTDPAPA